MAAIGQFDVVKRIHKLSVLPTLIVHGESDMVIPIKYAQIIADKIKG